MGSVILSKDIGLPGVPLTYALVSGIICLGGYSIVLFRHFFKDRHKTYSYLGFLFKNVLLQVLSMGLVYYVSTFIDATTIIMLLVKGVAVVLMSLLCYFILGRLDPAPFRYGKELFASLRKK